jgi:hypothetical protein
MPPCCPIPTSCYGNMYQMQKELKAVGHISRWAGLQGGSMGMGLSISGMEQIQQILQPLLG